jgi:hypothetical protein
MYLGSAKCIAIAKVCPGAATRQPIRIDRYQNVINGPAAGGKCLLADRQKGALGRVMRVRLS